MTTTNTKLEDIILQAVDIITSKKIAKAGYDKTVQATIVSCIDSSIGKYKVKYQDSYWIAYSNNIDNNYMPNTSVYILIPGGDLSKDKTILGTTKRLGINYITMAEQDKKVTPVGSNIITTNTSWNLCSYKTETKVLYSYTFTDEQNILKIDTQAAEQYIKNSSSIIAGGYIKNKLETQQRFQGNYGILFGLDFFDSATRKVVTRYYTIDVDNMNGNPYYYPNKVRQYGVFEIDGANFNRINMIAVFTKDFPVQANGKEDDIFISDFELCGASSLQGQDLDSCALVLLTPRGYIFSENSANADTRTFEAQLRVKGKIIDLESQKVDFYWFKENSGISAVNPKYNNFGGQGWECLNSYRVIRQQQINGAVTIPAIYQFTPGSNILSIKKSDLLIETTKFKCVAVYDDIVLSRQGKIVRKDAEYILQINSSRGTNFYNNAGTTTLTLSCKRRNNNTTSNVDVNTLNFVWSSTNNVGNFNILPETQEYNIDRAQLVALQQAIELYITAEFLLNQQIYNVSSLFPSDNTINEIVDSTRKTQVINAKNKIINSGLTSTTLVNNLLSKYNITTTNLTYRLVLDGDENHNNSLKATINEYQNIQRVSLNQIIGVNISNITNFITFNCSVYLKSSGDFIGSTSITLKNSLKGSGYSLLINNGTQVFKYNTHGVSPTSKQNATSMVIPALTFTVYDNNGNAIDNDIISNATINWIVPDETVSLLRIEDGLYNNVMTSSSTQTKHYRATTSLSYGIAEKYNAKYKRNNIELKVQYNGQVLYATTNLSFLKQGENGTNGTDFVCKIIPNVLNGNTPVNPTIYYNGSSTTLNWTTDTTYNKWFKAQLWHNGNSPIFEGTETGNSTEGKTVTVVKWEVLKNIYSNNKTDSTNLTVTKATQSGSWSFGFTPGSFSSSYGLSTYSTWRPANIIKVTLSYDGMIYYATLPIIVCRIFNNNYSVQLKDYSGFRQVLYSSSGQSPVYDSSSPFEILTYYKVGSNLEDISEKTSSTYKINYNWYFMGSIWNRQGASWVEQKETTESSAQNGTSSKKWLMYYNNPGTTKINQKSIKPVDIYNGECVNIGLACRVSLNSNDTTIAWIHIPIHMMRNRFENSAINGWDGNSVNLGGTNGGMILAPQVGAGVKDDQNGFTGVFIGTAKDPQQGLSSSSTIGSTNEDVGLFGYKEGARTIFLDAKTGKAIFGKTGKAQIILDPSSDVAQIYSGNYSTTGNNRGGLLINLTTPEIKFGTGNFNVDANGWMIAKGGGQIAGWQINNNAIFNKKTTTGINRNSTGMNANPIVDSTSTSINNTGNGSEYRSVKIPPDSNSASTGYKTVGKAAAFWAGGSNFYVTHDGYLRVNEASIGSGNKPIFIGKSGTDNSAIFSGIKSTKNANTNGFYLGVDGLAIGTLVNQTINGNTVTVSKFQVDNDGTLYANSGYFRGSINTTNGVIGNWQINSGSITYGTTDNWTDSNSQILTTGIYFGSRGLRMGANFHVDNSGNLYVNNGQFHGKIISKNNEDETGIKIDTAIIEFNNPYIPDKEAYGTLGGIIKPAVCSNVYIDTASSEYYIEDSVPSITIDVPWEFRVTRRYNNTNIVHLRLMKKEECIISTELNSLESQEHGIMSRSVCGWYGNFQKGLSCAGTKSRVVNTADYGSRALYSYETPTPMFGDIGNGIINEDGQCYISIDPVFAQTVTTDNYQIFLQAYGDGKCYVKEKHSNYFIVAGDAGLNFDWQIKAKQKDFDQFRLNDYHKEISIGNFDEQDYGSNGAEHIRQIQNERLVVE